MKKDDTVDLFHWVFELEYSRKRKVCRNLFLKG